MFLITLPLQEETIIRLYQMIGFVSAVLAAIAILRLASMHNNLPLKKAVQYLNECKITQAGEETKKTLQPTKEEPPPVNTRKQLLVYTIAPDAQNLLSKISVQASKEDGWRASQQ